MTYSDEELHYQIAITLINGVGDITAKNLIAYCGSAPLVFKEKKQHFLKIPGIAEKTATLLFNEINRKELLERAEKELFYIKQNNIQALFFTHENYPRRLKHYSDSPILLYYSGCGNLNENKIVSVVGTRSPTANGKNLVEEFVTELKNTGILIVSGLAYGIDVLAHKAALDNNLDTIGVLGHGLDSIYPAVHDSISMKMKKQGGLLTEFMSETRPDRENFPKRNRIVAGMCDALVVVESKLKGGSLITAEIANSYNKDVFAFPGKSTDEFSSGCNAFIKRNKAALIENAADLFYAMSWQESSPIKPSKTAQLPLFFDLSEKEQLILNALKTKDNLHIDEMCAVTQLPMSEIAGLLLQLEFSNIVRSLPGKIYSLN